MNPMASVPDLLTPGERSRLDRIARTLAGRSSAHETGGRAGMHPSHLPGDGVAFVDRRRYEPGDDPRRIDWRLLARTNRMYIRRFEREADLDIALVLDSSGSMGFSGLEPAAPGERAKGDEALRLAAGIVHLARRRRDRVTMTRTDGRSLGEAIAKVVGRGPRHAALVVFSDFLDPIASWRSAVAWAAGRGASVRLWQVLTADELRLPRAAPRGVRAILDPETGRGPRVDLAAVRDAYAARMRRFVHACQLAAGQVGAQHRLHRVGDDLVDALAAWLGASWRPTRRAGITRKADEPC